MVMYANEVETNKKLQITWGNKLTTTFTLSWVEMFRLITQNLDRISLYFVYNIYIIQFVELLVYFNTVI